MHLKKVVEEAAKKAAVEAAEEVRKKAAQKMRTEEAAKAAEEREKARCISLGTLFTGCRLCRRPLGFDIWMFGGLDALMCTGCHRFKWI